jgi:tetratricopeptide (TPR) repeat protein
MLARGRSARDDPGMRLTLALLLCVLLLCGSPAVAQPRPDPKTVELGQLLDGLALAPSEELAARMEQRIGQLWLQAGGPTAAMLMSRGQRNLQTGQADDAVADLDAALALEPDLADAYARRGMARYETGDVSGAIRDLQETLRREPRHFMALKTLSRIAEAQGNWAGALAAWKRLLEIDPRTQGAQSRLRELTIHVEGEGT